MNTIRLLKIHFLLVITSLILFAACNKSSSPSPASPTGTLALKLQSYVDTNKLTSLGQTFYLSYGTNKGRKIVVNQAQLLLSDIQLIGANGVAYSFSNQILHSVVSTVNFVIGSAPVNNYNSLSFIIGVDSNTDQNTNPTPSDTALYDSTLWYAGPGNELAVTTTGGYIFIDFEGSIDTSSNLSGAMAPFSYRIGTLKNLRRIQMPNQVYTYSIFANQTTVIPLIVNYAALFQGIPLNNPTNLNFSNPTQNALPIIYTVDNNIYNAGGIGQKQYFFSYK
jgi:hypothetical protein